MTATEEAIAVQYAVPRQGIPSAASLRRWAKAVLDKEPQRNGSMVIRIVDEEESRALNESYRHKNKPTNVLSFPYESPEYLEEKMLGDLVICSPVVEREAMEQQKEYPSHWAHMVVHGTLHLLGYDHITDAEAQVMEKREIGILKSLGFSDPYQETENGRTPE